MSWPAERWPNAYPAELSRHAAEQAEQLGLTPVWVGWDETITGVIIGANTVRHSSRATVWRLRTPGLQPTLLTGDNRSPAERVAEQVGITEAICAPRAGGPMVGGGSDVMIESSDLTPIRPALLLTVAAIQLSRRMLAIVKDNLASVFGHNMAAIPLAALAFLNPMVAAGPIAFSPVFVVGNSLGAPRFAANRPPRSSQP